MSDELYSATLDPRGPNYERLKHIFVNNRVPLKSPHASKSDLGEERDVPVYQLDLAALPLAQRAYLFSLIAMKCDLPMAQVEEVMEEHGFPIREADVIVAFAVRASV